jgi:hypothetical protein
MTGSNVTRASRRPNFRHPQTLHNQVGFNLRRYEAIVGSHKGPIQYEGRPRLQSNTQDRLQRDKVHISLQRHPVARQPPPGLELRVVSTLTLTEPAFTVEAAIEFFDGGTEVIESPRTTTKHVPANPMTEPEEANTVCTISPFSVSSTSIVFSFAQMVHPAQDYAYEANLANSHPKLPSRRQRSRMRHLNMSVQSELCPTRLRQR